MIQFSDISSLRMLGDRGNRACFKFPLQVKAFLSENTIVKGVIKLCKVKRIFIVIRLIRL
ncbi:MAG: hypothetical protein VR69_12285 [Peptococcaceae bacterium BRH_c4b]|nr:MAG: hypothetical protein VR69_12285 [Peptococcaceae bacterium BRH_c4b]